MAPPSVTSAKRPVTPAVPADVALGDVAARRDAAVATISEFDNNLGRVDAALKDPAHADKRGALQALKTKYTRERQAAVKVRDAAQRSLDASFGALRGTGSARDAAGNEFQKLTSLDVQLAGTELSKRAAVQVFKAATDSARQAVQDHGMNSPQAKAALAKAEAASAMVEQLERDLGALQHARSAVAAELQGTERQAFAEAKKAGDAAVSTMDSFSQLAAVDAQQQRAVLGAPMVGVTQREAVDADLTALTRAGAGKRYADDAAASVAKTFTAQLKTATDRAQEALVTAAAKRSDLLPAMASMADKSPNAANAVADTLKAASGDARLALATELAKGTTSMKSELVKTLDARMQNGDGFEAAFALSKGLKAAGKPELARQVDALITTRMGALTKDFESKSADVAQAKVDLARLISGFGPLVPPEKQQAAVAAFKARHQKEFAAWEASGSKLARAAEFISYSQGWNEKAAALLPDALSTQGGQALVTQALSDSGKGLRTFLDGAKDSSKVAKNLQLIAVKATAQQALSLTRLGKTTEAKAALEALKKNGLLGMDPAKTDKVLSSLQGVIDGKQGALESFNDELRKAKPSEGLGTALKAFGWAASIASGLQRGLNAKDLKSSVKASAEVVGPTGEIAAWTVELLSKSEASAIKALEASVPASKGVALTAPEAAWATNSKMLGKGLGAIGSGLGAALDAIASVQSFADGKTVEGSLSAASAIGGAVLAVDSFGAALGMQVVPVWGQIAGAALVIGGTIGKAAWEWHKGNVREENAEADAKAYLEAAGVHPLLANELSDIKRADGRNVGMMIQQVAHGLGVSPRELFDRVTKLPQDKLRDFIDTMKDVELDDHGKMKDVATEGADAARHYSETNGDVVTYYRPRSRETATQWTRQFLKDNGV